VLLCYCQLRFIRITGFIRFCCFIVFSVFKLWCISVHSSIICIYYVLLNITYLLTIIIITVHRSIYKHMNCILLIIMIDFKVCIENVFSQVT